MFSPFTKFSKNVLDSRFNGYRPLSRDVTHDELRIWPPCWRENKKEQKKFLKKIRE